MYTDTTTMTPNKALQAIIKTGQAQGKIYTIDLLGPSMTPGIKPDLDTLCDMLHADYDLVVLKLNTGLRGARDQKLCYRLKEGRTEDIAALIQNAGIPCTPQGKYTMASPYWEQRIHNILAPYFA